MIKHSFKKRAGQYVIINALMPVFIQLTVESFKTTGFSSKATREKKHFGKFVTRARVKYLNK